VFLKEVLNNQLDDLRTNKLNFFASRIQRCYKAWRARSNYRCLRSCAVAFQTAIRRFFVEKQFVVKKRAIITFQAAIRSRSVQVAFRQQRKAAVVLQARCRGFLAQRKLQQIKQGAQDKKDRAAAILQAEIRTYLALKKYKREIQERVKKAKSDEARLPPEERAKRQAEREAEALRLAQMEKQRRDEEKEERRKKEEELQKLQTSQQPASSSSVASASVSVDDFDATLAELQAFIEGEVFTMLSEQKNPGGLKQALEKGIDLQAGAQSQPDAAKKQTFDVFLNYSEFKLLDFAMNHFQQHTKGTLLGKKKTGWAEMLQFTKVRIEFASRMDNFFFFRWL
jgi:hypothetical protein